MVGKDKGKQGNVAAYIRELNAVFVSGLNTVGESDWTRHVIEGYVLGNTTNQWWCCGTDFHRFERKTLDCTVPNQTDRSI